MRYAIVTAGIVDNIVEWDGGDGWSPPEGSEAVEAVGPVSIGWTYDGEAFTPAAAPVLPAPDSVSARQFKLQLLSAGLLASVEAWIGSQGQAVQIAYDNSGFFVRSEPMMQSGFAALGFTDQQIDDFFRAAVAL
ncbi:hypothetical protein [Mesorhizobium sp. BE184]|uniref:hypothetical protein n=1 Tax=Mesorhizobium sp. BE184 TaxID=2817714 RepID=UPI002857FC3C|nr:hypothetical protein [Mesorhizobium sp. BE184]MDR7032925.1 hypothetical protein [Mesorhizobium sp. BE184]